jgi:HEAT repeat protein
LDVRARALLLALSSLLSAWPAWAGDLFDDVEQVAAELRAPEVSRRREAVDKLDAFRPDEARPHLLFALNDGDVEVRARAALALGRRRIGEAAPRLIQLLGDPDPKLRAAAATALGQVAANADAEWPQRTAHALERALGDGEHEVREAAVVAIAALPRPLAQSVAVAITGRLDDDHPAVRQRAASALQKLGEARAVIPLVGRLSDGSREVRVAALEALGELGDAKAASAMIRLLNDPADEVRTAAVQALGRLHARAAVAPLTELLERGVEPFRGRAAVALGQVAAGAPIEGNDPAVAALVSALGRDDLRQAAREGLRLAGPSAVAPLSARLPAATGDELAIEIDLLGELGDARAASTLLAELERGRVPRERVVDALAQVAHRTHGLSVELTALLGDSEAAVRRRAAHALAGTADGRAASALAEATADADRDVRLTAIAELGRLRSQKAIPSLEKALAASDAETAAAAARALGEVGDQKAGVALEAALGRNDRRVRREAADALARIGDNSQVQPVMRRAKTGGAERQEAIAAIGGLLRGKPDPVARELLLGYAEGSDSNLAVEALDALAAMRDPLSTSRVLRLLAKRDAEIRRHAVRAAGELGGDESENALVTRLSDDRDAAVMAEAAWALGKGRGSAGALAALERALASPSPEVRANAAAAFARLGHPPQLLTRLLHDPDPAVRTNAAIALKPKKSSSRNDWIGLYLVDFDGAPLANARYRLLLPDGLVKTGQADGRGVVREESLPRGACQLELVDEPQGRS